MFDVDGDQVGFGGVDAVSNSGDTRYFCEQVRDGLTVDASNNFSTRQQAVKEFAKSFDDVIEVAVEIEVIGFNIGNEDSVGRNF